ncbi:MAG: hypothetical protein KTR31_23690, partial [Myxococcales bacterium]|nr:hypothetical protein [Myxococcales bacterium]
MNMDQPGMASLDAVRRRLVEQLQVLVRREAALERHLRGQDGRADADFPWTPRCVSCAASEGGQA